MSCFKSHFSGVFLSPSPSCRKAAAIPACTSPLSQSVAVKTFLTSCLHNNKQGRPAGWISRQRRLPPASRLPVTEDCGPTRPVSPRPPPQAVCKRPVRKRERRISLSSPPPSRSPPFRGVPLCSSHAEGYCARSAESTALYVCGPITSESWNARPGECQQWDSCWVS